MLKLIYSLSDKEITLKFSKRRLFWTKELLIALAVSVCIHCLSAVFFHIKALKPKNEIIVEALDVVEIEFRVGNGDMKRITLKPDQIHTIKALGPVILNLSDGGAVNLIHNGRDKGVPGDLGKPKRIKIQ